MGVPDTLVTGNSASSMSINGTPLGCIVGDLADNLSLEMKNLSGTMCDTPNATKYQQSTAGFATRTVSATVQFLTDGAGIEAAETVAESKALCTVSRTFAGHESGTDTKAYQGYITTFNKSVSANAERGQVQVTVTVIDDGAITP